MEQKLLYTHARDINAMPHSACMNTVSRALTRYGFLCRVRLSIQYTAGWYRSSVRCIAPVVAYGHGCGVVGTGRHPTIRAALFQWNDAIHVG